MEVGRTRREPRHPPRLIMNLHRLIMNYYARRLRLIAVSKKALRKLGKESRPHAGRWRSFSVDARSKPETVLHQLMTYPQEERPRLPLHRCSGSGAAGEEAQGAPPAVSRCRVCLAALSGDGEQWDQPRSRVSSQVDSLFGARRSAQRQARAGCLRPNTLFATTTRRIGHRALQSCGGGNRLHGPWLTTRAMLRLS